MTKDQLVVLSESWGGEIKDFLFSDVMTFERNLQELDSNLRSLRHGKSKVAGRLLLEKWCDEILLKGEKLLKRVNIKKTKKEVKRNFRNIVFKWISKNPFMKRGLEKPRGYPGDYMMMEMGYDQVILEGGVGLDSELDRLCYKKYRAIPLRKDKIREIIRECLEASNKQRLRILTLGGGPCREWLELERVAQRKWGEGRVFLSYLDQDDEATKFARSHIQKNKLISKTEYYNESLLSFTKSAKWKDHHKQYDLVYILGVGDYLGDSFLADIISQALNLITKGGRFVITQKDRTRFNLVFLDWFCDWNFVKRNENEFSRLLQEAVVKTDGRFKCKIIREQTGQIMFGIITRL